MLNGDAKIHIASVSSVGVYHRCLLGVLWGGRGDLLCCRRMALCQPTSQESSMVKRAAAYRSGQIVRDPRSTKRGRQTQARQFAGRAALTTGALVGYGVYQKSARYGFQKLELRGDKLLAYSGRRGAMAGGAATLAGGVVAYGGARAAQRVLNGKAKKPLTARQKEQRRQAARRPRKKRVSARPGQG